MKSQADGATDSFRFRLRLIFAIAVIFPSVHGQIFGVKTSDQSKITYYKPYIKFETVLPSKVTLETNKLLKKSGAPSSGQNVNTLKIELDTPNKQKPSGIQSFSQLFGLQNLQVSYLYN